jgi:hypothetical protein
MADDESLRIAIFKLENCARWMLGLSQQTESETLRRCLLLLSRDLEAKVEELIKAAQGSAASK